MTTQREEGLVNDILSRGDLTAEEMEGELQKKDLCFTSSYDRPLTVLFLVLIILWLLPAVARWTGWGVLSFFARLPRVDFPVAVIVVAGAFVVAAVCLEAKVSSMRHKRGGLQDVHETMIIVREGPYRVVRHPGYLAEITYFALIPVLLSRWVPYTILAAIASAGMIAGIVYLITTEDRFNQRKWGVEYRRYMRKVPAINFLKGLKKLRDSSAPRTSE